MIIIFTTRETLRRVAAHAFASGIAVLSGLLWLGYGSTVLMLAVSSGILMTIGVMACAGLYKLAALRRM